MEERTKVCGLRSNFMKTTTMLAIRIDRARASLLSLRQPEHDSNNRKTCQVTPAVQYVNCTEGLSCVTWWGRLITRLPFVRQNWARDNHLTRPKRAFAIFDTH